MLSLFLPNSTILFCCCIHLHFRAPENNQLIGNLSILSGVILPDMVQVLSSWYVLLLSHESKYPSYKIIISDNDQRNLWLPKARGYNPQSNYDDAHLYLCPAKFRLLLDPSKLPEPHSWGLCLLPEPEHQAHGSASAYCCVMILHCRAHEMFLRTTMIISDGLERSNVVKSKCTKSSWLKWALLLSPACLKHSFRFLEILHIKKLVMICLSLTGSFVMESGSFADLLLSFLGNGLCCNFE